MGVFPLFVLAILFIFLGSYGIEKSTDELNQKLLDYKSALHNKTSDIYVADVKHSLDVARYNRSMNVYMLVCAAVMIVHALAILYMKERWPSAYVTMAISLVVIGIMRRFNNIGDDGTSNALIYMGSAVAFVMGVFATNDKFEGIFKNKSEFEFEEH